jgi:hypothetical protein
MESGAITSAEFVYVLDSILTNVQMTNAAGTAALTLSDGTAGRRVLQSVTATWAG